MALYDPNEFPETETGVDFTLADVLAWARSKPADEEYNYIDPDNCALGQCGQALGRPELIGLGPDEIDEMFPGLDRVANPFWGDLTFGAFADRLEKALS